MKRKISAGNCSGRDFPFIGHIKTVNVPLIMADGERRLADEQKNLYIRVAFGDVHHSVCTERESGWNPEQCPLLCACLMQILSEPLLREGVSVRRVRKPAR